MSLAGVSVMSASRTGNRPGADAGRLPPEGEHSRVAAHDELAELEYQQLVRLHDGRRVFIRPILPGDATELAEGISSADADTIDRRFLGGRPPVTPELMAHLTSVGYVRRFALVAINPARRQGVAIARYESVGNGVAEVAVAVAPAWRDGGLPTELVQLLAQPPLSGVSMPSLVPTWRKTVRLRR